MIVVSPRKAKKFFKAKMEFTTGPEELNYMIRRRANIQIIDMRTREDYANAHVPGAINLSKDMWSSCLGLKKNKLNVVYCYSTVCRMAAGTASEFAGKGYPVIELEGGFEAWAFYGFPVEKSTRYYPLPIKARGNNIGMEQQKFKQIENKPASENISKLLKCNMLEI